MRFAWLILLLLSSLNLNAQGLLFVKGNYQGNNLYVQNPATDAEGEYCIDSVYLNGRLVLSDLNLNAFEIALDTLLAPTEDTVELKIFHKPNCKPTILNPHIYPKSIFKIDSVAIDTDGMMYFSIEGKGYLECRLEQYRWNKWVKVDAIRAVRLPFDTLVDVSHNFHSGTNKFRLAAIEYTGNKTSSQDVTVETDRPLEEYQYNRELQAIIFDQFTQYEIYDSYGNIVLRGESKQIDLQSLKKGAYYLNFGNQNVKFIKKPPKK